MANDQSQDGQSIRGVVDGLEELGENKDEVCVKDVLDKFGSNSFAPVMLVFALIGISPVGAIPGVPTFIALSIALIAVQQAMGRDRIWVPGWIADRSVSGDKLDKATDKMEGVAKKLDNLTSDRLTSLTSGFAVRIAGLIIALLCCVVPVLEVLPWAAAVPMFAIATISVALMVRDGLAMLIAYIVAGLATSGIIYWFLGSGGSGSGSGSGGGILPF